jgi:hypothetical protein
MENTDSKNQHYVPKFYLRHFSVNSIGKEIRLFNIKSEKFVPTASLKHQASSNFFYGKDGRVENQLSKLEGLLARAVLEVIKTQDRPKYFSRTHVELLNFAISTDLRNPIRKLIFEKLNEGVLKKILSTDPRFKDNPDFVKAIEMIEIVPNNSSIYSLSYIRNAVEITLDLHFKLLINKTAIPFVTSDNPVIRYNQFLEEKSTSNSITGFGLQGLQMFIPLNENILLLFYDEQTYYVGDRRKRNVLVDKLSDIDQLNLLQTVNCYSNIYGGDLFTKEYADELCRKAKYYPEFHRVQQQSVPSRNNDNGEIVTQTIDSLKTNLNLSFIFLSTFADRFPKIGDKIAMRRKAEEVRRLHEFESEAEKTARKR